MHKTLAHVTAIGYSNDTHTITEIEMSEDAKTLVFWANAYRNTAIADYDNSYEFCAARRWAEYIFNN